MAAGELRCNDSFLYDNGIVASLHSIQRISYDETLFNLEAAGEYVFEISNKGLLVHNAYPKNNSNQPAGGTYKLVDSKGKVVRTGRTKNLELREQQHKRDPVLGKYKFKVDKRTDNYFQQRGREQIIHDKYKPRLDKIRPIRANHPLLGDYMEAAKEL